MFNKITTRLGITAIALFIAGSAAALDVTCCGDGPDGPDFDGPGDLAAPEIGDTDDGGDEAIGGGDGGQPFISGRQPISGACDAAGGAYMLANQCYDRDGNFINQ